MTLEEGKIDINYIKGVLQELLQQQHTHPIKKNSLKAMPQQINPERLAMACPVCGDSDKVPSKKRGNLYLKNLRYKCFNCGFSATFLGLLKNFGFVIDLKEKMQLVEYINTNMEQMSWNDDQFITNNLDKLIPISVISEYFNSNPNNLSKIKNFKPVVPNSVVYNYLTNRKIFDHTNIYEATYHYTDKWFEPIIVSINGGKSKTGEELVLGLQVRNIKEDRNKRFYKIFKFSEIYNWVHTNPEDLLDDIETNGYDKLSYLYNILKVDWFQPISIFEGYLDTKFFPNSIGCTGGDTDLNFILNQEANIRFVYDHDKAGMSKTKKVLSDGFRVFLWDKFFLDWSKKSKRPVEAYRKLVHNIVDLNDVGKIVNNPFKSLQMDKYFSVDKIDLMYIKDIVD